jgi:hypothetical protein
MSIEAISGPITPDELQQLADRALASGQAEVAAILLFLGGTMCTHAELLMLKHLEPFARQMMRAIDRVDPGRN